MLRPEDAEKILTTHDLSVYLKDIVQKEDRDLKIDIDYESGELSLSLWYPKTDMRVLVILHDPLPL